MQEATELKILSLDGAVSAALQVRMLYHIEEAWPGFLASIDMFAGASDSAVMALYLAQNVSDSHRSNLEVVKRCIQFSNDLIAGLSPRPFHIARFLTGFWPLRSGRKLRSTLTEYFGENARFGDLRRKALVISIDVTGRRPKTFRNFGYDARDNRDRSLVDVAYASCSFPVYLPVGSGDNGGQHLYIDGSLIANNPTMIVITNAISMLAGEGESGWSWSNMPSKSEELRKLQVLSLGAVQDCPPHRSGDGPLHWGYWRWLLTPGINLVALLFYGLFLGSSEEIHNQALHLLGSARYGRYQPVVPYLDIARTLLLNRGARLPELLDALAAQCAKEPSFQDLINRWMKGWGVSPAVGHAAAAPPG
ncbi:patatin-like phospholipase family protein [Sorangium sp. So ce375]|uniref:patatin-like phospholipase family protein n=1 Tax=Sorangium sp. So ce375 TaxID=3133306 RepID=UPI003F5C1C0E